MAANKYRLRYARWVPGLKPQKMPFFVDFEASGNPSAAAQDKWNELVDRKYATLDFQELAAIVDWEPSP